MSYTLGNRCFGICSNWSVFHSQLTHLRKMTQKNGYPENFIDRCFKLFLNRTHILREKKKRKEEQTLRLVLSYLWSISLQIGTKLQKPIKMVLNCCKLQFIFKSQIKRCNNFHFEGAISQVLTSGAVCKFQCKLCKKLYHGERVRHLTVRIGGRY